MENFLDLGSYAVSRLKSGKTERGSYVRVFRLACFQFFPESTTSREKKSCIMMDRLDGLWIYRSNPWPERRCSVEHLLVSCSISFILLSRRETVSWEAVSSSLTAERSLVNSSTRDIRALRAASTTSLEKKKRERKNDRNMRQTNQAKGRVADRHSSGLLPGELGMGQVTICVGY